MENALDIASSAILQPVGLQHSDMDKVLAALGGSAIDAADIYFQSSWLESWSLEDGIIKEGNYSIERGAGIRAISGEKTGFAYVDDIELPQLINSATTARAIASAGSSHRVALSARPLPRPLYQPGNPINSISDEEKTELLRMIDREARAQDVRVQQVMASLVAARDVVLIVSDDGHMSADVRPMVRCQVSVIVEHHGRREQGGAGGGGRFMLDELVRSQKPQQLAREAVRMALVNLDAVAAPAGSMPVVLGPGWPGVLLHEAVGHGLEGDFNRKGTSAFSGRMGEQVASPLCTVVDDGTLAQRRGSLTIDDEGCESQNTVLIEKGVLKNYMQDKLNARLMGMQPTGNGRRESYAHLPMPRMTNTYMLAGEHDPAEIIASVEKGLYAVNFGGGQVDITSGKFVFSANEAYLIENGKITSPVKGATLIGNGPEAMNRISMVGNDLQLDDGVGVCGKEGQSVPVGVGQPSLRMDDLTVGGTSA